MKFKVIEAVSEAGNWGKFGLLRFDEEWAQRSSVSGFSGSLLAELGWTPQHLWIMDLQTGEGAFFKPGGYAHADLEKHAVWVCPLFEPTLEKLYTMDLTDLDALPDSIVLDNVPLQLSGYRRPGPDRLWQELLEAANDCVADVDPSQFTPAQERLYNALEAVDPTTPT